MVLTPKVHLHLDWLAASMGLGKGCGSGPHGLVCNENLCSAVRSLLPFSFLFFINIKLKDPRIHSDFWPVFLRGSWRGNRGSD